MESSARVYGGVVATRDTATAKRLLAAVGVTAAAFGGAFAAGSVVKSSSTRSVAPAPPLASPVVAGGSTAAVIPALSSGARIPGLRPAATVGGGGVTLQSGSVGNSGSIGNRSTGTQQTYHYVPPSNPGSTGGVQHGQDGGGTKSGGGTSGVAHGGG
jgi:hypothetical protein